MRNLTAIIILCFFGVGIASAETITAPNLIISDEPFMQGGTVEMYSVTSEVNKIERGVFNGVDYKFYYTDGSGEFAGTPGNTEQSIEGNWSTSCKKDPITDKKMCYMHMNSLWIFVHGDGKILVSIGYEHFPGSSVTVRIDGESPITASSANGGNYPLGTSAKIIERLKRCKSLTTRYMKWPYRSWVDKTWEIYGFNETFKYINWAVRHIK